MLNDIEEAMPIIIHASRDFAKRFRCDLSLAGEKVEQAGRLDAWSGHLTRVNRKPILMMMNDACLWSIILPAAGLTTLEKFLPVFLERVAEVWISHGVAFDPSNQSVVFLSRTNRSLIGSMSDAVAKIRFVEEAYRFDGKPMNWREMEDYLNRMPYGALNYYHPDKQLRKLLAEGD